MEDPARRIRSVALRAASVAAAVAVLLLLLRGLDRASLGAALRSADPWPIAAAALLNLVANTWAKALRWKALLAPLPGRAAPPKTRELAALLLAGTAVSNVLPARAGEALRALQLQRTGYSLAGMVAAQLLEKLVEVISMGSLALLALLSLRPGPLLATPLAISAAGSAGAIVLLLVLARLPPAAGPLEQQRGLRGALHRLRENLALQLPPRVWLRSAGWSLASDLIDIATVGLSLLALGLHLPAAGWVAVFITVNLAIAVPSTPGQIGAVEASAVFALRALGAGPAEALAAALVYHAVHLVPTTVAGALALRQRPSRPESTSPGVRP